MRMKENVRNVSENMRLNIFNSKKKKKKRVCKHMIGQKVLNIYTIKKLYLSFFVCMYKMIDISQKKAHENNDIKVIVDGIGLLWLNKKHVEEKLGHKNFASKYDSVYKSHRYGLVDKPKKQPNRRFLRSDLALKVIMDCRTDDSCNLKRNIGFRLH